MLGITATGTLPTLAHLEDFLADVLIQIFIDAERGIYDEAGKKGGWEGWKEFKVARKVKESDEVVSLYLDPREKVDLPEYRPGQYVAVSLYVPALGYKQARQ